MTSLIEMDVAFRLLVESEIGEPLCRDAIRPLAYTQGFNSMVARIYGDNERSMLRHAWEVLLNATEGT